MPRTGNDPSGPSSGNPPSGRKSKSPGKDRGGRIEEIRKIKVLLEHCVSSLDSLEKDLLTDGKPKLPVNNAEEFRRLERYLDSPIHMEDFSTMVSKWPGLDTVDFLEKALERIMAIDLAIHFCWLGSNDKQGFKETNTGRAVIDAAKLFGVKEQFEIDLAIKNWLLKVPFLKNPVADEESS